jgi:hypothetical protein
MEGVEGPLRLAAYTEGRRRSNILSRHSHPLTISFLTIYLKACPLVEQLALNNLYSI